MGLSRVFAGRLFALADNPLVDGKKSVILLDAPYALHLGGGQQRMVAEIQADEGHILRQLILYRRQGAVKAAAAALQ